MKQVRFFAALFAAQCMLAGCQSQNPYSVIGPATIPSPTASQAPPYYPPLVGQPAVPPFTPAKLASSAPAPRLSVSAESASAPRPIRPSFVPEPADREPLRIVENPIPPTRTAAAPRPNVPIAIPAPVGSLPPTVPRMNPLPTNAAPPRPATTGSSPTSYSPPGTAPGFNRTRGFYTPPPYTGGVSRASYESAAPAFIEGPPASGQWRAR